MVSLFHSGLKIYCIKCKKFIGAIPEGKMDLSISGSLTATRHRATQISEEIICSECYLLEKLKE